MEIPSKSVRVQCNNCGRKMNVPRTICDRCLCPHGRLRMLCSICVPEDTAELRRTALAELITYLKTRGMYDG
jgi:hypothetical protein